MNKKLFEVTMANEGWDEKEGDSNVVNLQNEGDKIQGIYINFEPEVGSYNQNRYTILLPDGEEKYVYGTRDLDAKMSQVSLENEVYILLYKLVPQKPPKSSFKVFRVYEREPVTNGSGDIPAPKENLSDEDDSEARNMIEVIVNELGEENPEAIIEYAEEVKKDWELSGKDITRIKAQLVRMFPSKEEG